MDYQYISNMTNRTGLYNYSYMDYPQDTGNYSIIPEQKPGCSVCKTFDLVFYGVIIGLLCIFGILGNTLSIVVLQKDRNNKVAGFLLQALAVADNSVLLVSFIILSMMYGIVPQMRADSSYLYAAVAYSIKYVHPIGYMAQTSTIWVTVLLSFNRFIAICQPFRAHKLCTRKKVQIQVACVFLFALLFNIPRFFQFKIITKEHPYRPGLIVTLAVGTSIGEHTLFGIIYSNALYTILVLLLPLLLLLFLNISLIIEMRKMQKRMVSMGPRVTTEENITVVMVIIVVVFLVCHTPDRIQMILHYILKEKLGLARGQPGYYFHATCNFLIVLNSSTNFLIYYFFRRRFREILFKKLCCLYYWKKKDRVGHNSEYVDSHNMTLLTKVQPELPNGNGVVKNGDKLLLTSDKA